MAATSDLFPAVQPQVSAENIFCGDNRKPEIRHLSQANVTMIIVVSSRNLSSKSDFKLHIFFKWRIRQAQDVLKCLRQNSFPDPLHFPVPGLEKRIGANISIF